MNSGGVQVSRLVYAVPPLGALVGACLVRLMILIGPVRELQIYIQDNVLLGRGLASTDNLTMAGGLLGIAGSAIALNWWIEKQKATSSREDEEQ